MWSRVAVFLLATSPGFLLGAGSLASSPSLEEEWKQTKAADSPVAYARFLEAHPQFDRTPELLKRLRTANRRAVEKGRQVDLMVTRYERVEAPSRGSEALVYLGETADRAGQRYLWLELKFDGGRLVPGEAKERSQGSWAYFSAEPNAVVDSTRISATAQTVLAVVWGPDRSRPPAEVYLGGSRSLRLVTVAGRPSPSDSLRQPANSDSIFTFEEPAVAIKIFTPDYPDEAKRANIEGLVLVRATVSHTGRVVHAEVHSSDTVPVLEAAAMHAALLSLFRPATRNGIPVEDRVVLPFRFKLN